MGGCLLCHLSSSHGVRPHGRNDQSDREWGHPSFTRAFASAAGSRQTQNDRLINQKETKESPSKKMPKRKARIGSSPWNFASRAFKPSSDRLFVVVFPPARQLRSRRSRLKARSRAVFRARTTKEACLLGGRRRRASRRGVWRWFQRSLVDGLCLVVAVFGRQKPVSSLLLRTSKRALLRAGGNSSRVRCFVVAASLSLRARANKILFCVSVQSVAKRAHTHTHTPVVPIEPHTPQQAVGGSNDHRNGRLPSCAAVQQVWRVCVVLWPPRSPRSPSPRFVRPKKRNPQATNHDTTH